MWKMIQGKVPNCGLSWGTSGRRGLLVKIPPLTGSRVAIKTLREKSFQTEAPRLFNSLPMSLREHTGSVLSFKSALDRLLASVPDAPLLETRVTFATDSEGRPSNSLRHWLRAQDQASYARLLHESALGSTLSSALCLGVPAPASPTQNRTGRLDAGSTNFSLVN